MVDHAAVGRKSKRKGAAGERELAGKLREYGYACKRGVQYHGGKDSPDVMGLPGIHIECKRVERLDLTSAMSQAIGDSGDGRKPAVFHRRNNEPWKVTMLLEDWIELYREWEAENDDLR